MLLPLDAHCAALSHLLTAVEDESMCMAVCDWLLVASAVGSVELNTARHNIGYGWCSGADEFDDARETLLRQFVEDFSVFSFIWGALEAGITAMKIPRSKNKSKQGKVRDACYWLRSCFSRRPAVVGLVEEVDLFRQASRQCLGFEAVEKRFSEMSELGLAGIGLYAVYELRNSFAHGSIVFPMPDEDLRSVSSHESMVKYASRVVLLQFQMLLLAHFRDLNEMVSFHWHSGGTRDEVPLWLALRTCHLAQADRGYQLSLLGDD